MPIRHLSTFFMVAAFLAVLAPSAQAQHTAGQFARMVVIKPKPGQADSSTAGYERHLVWHKNNKDPWNNNKNVTPYADFVSHGVYERLESASKGALLPDASPYLVMTTYIVVPGREAAFELAIAELAAKADDQRVSWYKLRVGGPLHQYVLTRAARTFSDGALLPRIDLPDGLVQSAQSELLRYQPKLSYVP